MTFHKGDHVLFMDEEYVVDHATKRDVFMHNNERRMIVSPIMVRKIV